MTQTIISEGSLSLFFFVLLFPWPAISEGSMLFTFQELGRGSFDFPFSFCLVVFSSYPMVWKKIGKIIIIEVIFHASMIIDTIL